MTTRALGAAAVALGLTVACSSGDGDGTSTKRDTTTTNTPATSAPTAVQEFDVPSGSHPHDVAVASDGTVWYTAQNTGKLGHLDPESGRVDEVELGDGSAPHGVIVGPDGAAWSPMSSKMPSCASIP
jgi:streptogramin lyase